MRRNTTVVTNPTPSNVHGHPGNPQVVVSPTPPFHPGYMPGFHPFAFFGFSQPYHPNQHQHPQQQPHANGHSHTHQHR